MPKNIMCKNCNNLVNGWCERVIDSPVPDMERDCQYFWLRTNADRIRAMSDEELVAFIGKNSLCDRVQDESTWCVNRGVCTGCLVEWLQQPAGED